jgi:hypothetical protein
MFVVGTYTGIWTSGGQSIDANQRDVRRLFVSKTAPEIGILSHTTRGSVLEIMNTTTCEFEHVLTSELCTVMSWISWTREFVIIMSVESVPRVIRRSTGETVTVLSELNKGDKAFYSSSGRIVAANIWERRVQVYDSEFNCVVTRSFRYPVGLCDVTHDSVYVGLDDSNVIRIGPQRLVRLSLVDLCTVWSSETHGWIQYMSSTPNNERVLVCTYYSAITRLSVFNEFGTVLFSTDILNYCHYAISNKELAIENLGLIKFYSSDSGEFIREWRVNKSVHTLCALPTESVLL